MKRQKIISIFILLTLLSILIGCGNKENDNNSYNTEKLSADNNADNATNNNTNANANASVTNTIKNAEPQEISTFSTKVLDKGADKVHNLQLACSKINEVVIQPGQTFSFNDTVGRATEGAGYKKTQIMTKTGKLVPGFGGGVCQVSSTLFNTADLAKMEIIERHNHTKKVAYIESGRDAAIDYGNYDLKFKNNSSNAVKITATADTENVTIKMYKMP